MGIFMIIILVCLGCGALVVPKLGQEMQVGNEVEIPSGHGSSSNLSSLSDAASFSGVQTCMSTPDLEGGIVVSFLSHVWLLPPHGLQPTRLLCPWDFPGKNTGVGSPFLLQGIFMTQGSNLGLLHWQADSLPLSHQESPALKVELYYEFWILRDNCSL